MKNSHLSNIDFEEVPVWFPVCINKDCPRKDECLRYQATSALPAGHKTLFCIAPSQWESDGCPHFEEIRTVRMARGFSKLFDQVLQKHAAKLREDITSVLHGTRIYYECRDGKRLITPEEQEDMRQLVKRRGYTWEVPFDAYEEHILYPETLSAKVF